MRAASRLFLSRRSQRQATTRPSRAYAAPDPDTIIAELTKGNTKESMTAEYLKKRIAPLLEPQNARIEGHTYLSGAMNSQAFMEVLAEIGGTEFHVPKVEAKALKAKYQEQLANFESVRVPVLQKERQPAVIIDYLREIYTVRANVSLWELEAAIGDFAFLEGRNDIRVVSYPKSSEDVQRTDKERLLSLKKAGFPKGDEQHAFAENAAQNIRIFRGGRGLERAIAKGLTDEQYNHLYKVLTKDFISPERQQELVTQLSELTDALGQKIGNRKLRIKDGAIFRPFLSSLTENEANWIYRYAFSGVEEKSLVQPGDLPAGYDPEAFRSGVAIAAKETIAANPEQAESVNHLVDMVNILLEPEIQKQLRLGHMLANVKLVRSDVEKLLEPFMDKHGDDATLNDALNPHPLAVKLWGDRLWWMSNENLKYTKHYEDVDATGIWVHKEDHHDQAGIAKIEARNYAAPIMGPYPFNSGIEEIMQWKLQVLAEDYFGYNLSTSFGLAQFDYFVHNYDVSPGEETLDRCHPYPPPAHTYDELPIIKYDGWDEADVPEDYPEYVAQQKSGHAYTPQPIHATSFGGLGDPSKLGNVASGSGSGKAAHHNHHH